ncbi:MAG: DNA repair exonuclease [Clostridiales bacterium]|nr:DNA repair exonuclease [Clostridiales bacterium]
MLRLIHCADLHIDSAFAKLGPARRKEKREQLFESFNRLIDLIRQEKIAVCLIAGDLFDTPYPSQSAVDVVRSGFAYAEHCRFFITPGNHDPYVPGGVYDQTVFSPNVTIFKEPTLQKITLAEENTDIYGFAFTQKSMETPPPLNIEEDEADCIRILIAHADLSSKESLHCPLSEKDILNAGFDFTALGHLHNKAGMKQIGPAYYGYSGCLCGRDFGEPGEKGAFLCELTKQDNFFSMQHTFIPLSSVQYFEATVDITGCDSDSAAADRILQAYAESAFPLGCETRLVLTGEIPADYVPSGALSALLRLDGAFEIADRTRPLFQLEALKEELGLRGEFVRILLPLLEEGTDEEKEQAQLALRFGLQAMNGGDLHEI